MCLGMTAREGGIVGAIDGFHIHYTTAYQTELRDYTCIKRREIMDSDPVNWSEMQGLFKEANLKSHNFIFVKI